LIGVNLDAASDNTISGNRITGNENGINMRWGSSANTIRRNEITTNTVIGIYLAESASNNIMQNNIADNDKSVYTEYCGTNTFHHNNFVNNSKQWDDIGFTPWPIPLPISTSIWDDGKEGSYWSDYTGEDANDDGIGDTPYQIGINNTDRYPLMKPYSIIPPANGAQQSESSPTTWIAAATAVLALGVAIALGATIYKRKRSTANKTLN
jgi:nitrous oxidase accessory protein